MNPIVDTLVVGFLIVFMVFLLRGYHKMKDYENDDTYLSEEQKQELEKQKKQDSETKQD